MGVGRVQALNRMGPPATSRACTGHSEHVHHPAQQPMHPPLPPHTGRHHTHAHAQPATSRACIGHSKHVHHPVQQPMHHFKPRGAVRVHGHQAPRVGGAGVGSRGEGDDVGDFKKLDRQRRVLVGACGRGAGGAGGCEGGRWWAEGAGREGGRRGKAEGEQVALPPAPRPRSLSTAHATRATHPTS